MALGLGPGSIVDRYELLQQLAVGGMGEVHLARLSGVAGFGSLAVIKVLLPSFSTSKAFVAMFLEEARHVAKLRHPNIVQIRDIGDHAGQYYMVMEYIPGQNLRELLSDVSIPDNPLFAPRLGATVFAELACALAAVHDAGLVHRDISPNNIMIGDDGVAKLIDFGVARAIGSASLTTPGTLKGKYTYMAPEYIRGQPYDHRVDVFSLGVVLWETFTRRRLFRGGNAAEQLHQVMEGAILPIDRVMPGFPPVLADVVAGCLERDPSRRIASARELGDRLHAAARALPEPDDLTLRRWLERRLGDRIETRRTAAVALVDEISALRRPKPSTIDSSPVASMSDISEPRELASSIRIASGETTPLAVPRRRSFTRIGAVLSAFAILAILAIVAIVATTRAPELAAPPAAAPSVAPPNPAVELHRKRSLDALEHKQYRIAISEIAEAIRIGGADAELMQLLELARRLQQRQVEPQDLKTIGVEDPVQTK